MRKQMLGAAFVVLVFALSLSAKEPHQESRISHASAPPQLQPVASLAPDHDSLCQHHLAKSAASQPDAEVLAAELLDSTGSLATADEINALLANLVKQLARKRIDRKDAMAMAYTSQLLLSTLPGMDKEYGASFDAEATQEALEADEQSPEEASADLPEQRPETAPAPSEVLAGETSDDFAGVRT